jgi:hypothetical protein
MEKEYLESLVEQGAAPLALFSIKIYGNFMGD